MSEQIKRAIKLVESHIKANKQSLANGFEYTPKDEILRQNEEYCLILECLQSELDRQENKALTVSELKKMVGEPVWYKLHKSKCKDVWVSVIKEIKNDFMYFTDGTKMGFHEIVGVAHGNIVFHKHKPTEGVGR